MMSRMENYVLFYALARCLRWIFDKKERRRKKERKKDRKKKERKKERKKKEEKIGNSQSI